MSFNSALFRRKVAMNNKQKKKSYFDVRNKYITQCKKRQPNEMLHTG